METQTTLNELISKKEFSLQYVSIDDAIKRLGAKSRFIKTDITDAFKIIPISPKLWPYHGIQWKGKYYFFNKLVFGSRSSPNIFDSLSYVICWIPNNNYNIDNVLHLLDDFLGVVPEKEDAHEIKSIHNLKRLGVPLSAKKTEGPCHVLEYLGIYLDIAQNENC